MVGAFCSRMGDGGWKLPLLWRGFLRPLAAIPWSYSLTNEIGLEHEKAPPAKAGLNGCTGEASLT